MLGQTIVRPFVSWGLTIVWPVFTILQTSTV